MIVIDCEWGETAIANSHRPILKLLPALYTFKTFDPAELDPLLINESTFHIKNNVVNAMKQVSVDDVGEFTDSELKRYSRQMVLSGIGREGQRRIKEARVCVLGVGGLGCFSSLELAAIGVGHLRIVDRDAVEISNLQRQLLYDVHQLGYPKVEVAAERLSSLNPNIEIESVAASIDSSNVRSIIEGMDVVVDSFDSFSARYAVNRACLDLGIPYVFGGALEYYGNASSFIPGETACLECILPGMSDDPNLSCEVVGVVPSILGIIASVQVQETLRIILGRKPLLANQLLVCDLKTMCFDLFPLTKDPWCVACGKGREELAIIREKRVAGLCGKNSFMVVPANELSLDVPMAGKILAKRYRLRVQARVGITFEYNDRVSVSVFKRGHMLIKGVGDRDGALRIFDEVMKMIQQRNAAGS